MSAPYPLYDRLPEIYRAEDGGRVLERYLSLMERALGHVRDDISQLYDDHFIETCADWVIPYLADLVGASHLSGDAATLRADVADTVALRRRKGTLGAIELLAFNLTGWGAHAVEMRERLAWHQHLNHQRPDAGGAPPYGLLLDVRPVALPRTPASRLAPIRGGTVALRDPALLTLLGTPFDPFARLADVRPPEPDASRPNPPNLAIFLWRHAAHRVAFAQPFARGSGFNMMALPGEAFAIARFAVHPMGEPLVLYNMSRFDADARPLSMSELDHMPGPMPAPRLTTGAPAGNPGAYVAVNPYNDAPGGVLPPLTPEGLQLHVPQMAFGAAAFTFRGANLCAWESGLRQPLRDFEVAIDPVRGRIAIGVPSVAHADALRQRLLVTYTYGTVGAIGANPGDEREPLPTTWEGEPVAVRTVRFDPAVNTLEQALGNLEAAGQPVVIDIADSRTYDLDLAAVAGTLVEAGGPTLRLQRSLILRARRGERPVIRLAKPLRFRPRDVFDPDPAIQARYEAVMQRLTVRFEGIYLTRNAAMAATGRPLVARAAVNRLEIVSSVFDPMGYRRLDGTREPIRRSLVLRDGYGFAAGSNAAIAFSQTPEVVVVRSITGPLRMDGGYTLTIKDSIVDAGRGVVAAPGAGYCIASTTSPGAAWGPRTSIEGATFFGRVRVAGLNACGGIFFRSLQVEDNQHGCVKQSWFAGSPVANLADRLPQNYACVLAADARLAFTDDAFGTPGYGQLARTADFRIRERGPGDDAMGATGFLLEAHKWRNLATRLEEFMPVGVRALPIAVT